MDEQPIYPDKRQEIFDRTGEASSVELNLIKQISDREPFLPIRKGDRIQPFSLPDERGGSCNISDLLSSGPIVLSFNRGSWCAFCQMELTTWLSFLDDLAFYKTNFVSVSADVQWKQIAHEQPYAKENLKILYDQHFKVADSFGLRYKMTAEYQNAFDGFGLDLNDFYGEPVEAENHSLAVPATYIIDQSGNVIYDFIETDYTKRVEPFEIIKELIQHTRNTALK